MKKILSLFQRNHDGDNLVRDEVTPGAEWAIAGEGVATQKFDGTCCMVRGGKLFKRYEVKMERVPGSVTGWYTAKKPPKGYEPASGIDEVTGKKQGWVPVGDGPEDEWHREAFATLGSVPDGTFELVGPKIQGNPEGLLVHQLWRHGCTEIADEWVNRTFDGIKRFLSVTDVEGIVFHHPDGRMVKIKSRDFGLKRGKNVP